jgi:hypothetical protein
LNLSLTIAELTPIVNQKAAGFIFSILNSQFSISRKFPRRFLILAGRWKLEAGSFIYFGIALSSCNT